MKKYAIQIFIITTILLAVIGCSIIGPEPPYSPSPIDGATGVLAGVDLTWVGPQGANFDVYFGTSMSLGSPVAEGIMDGFYDPAPADDLTAGQIYYWRVDAIVNGRTIEGDLWSFTLAP